MPIAFDTSLPIVEILEDIRRHLAENPSLVVEAPPGAGKTTVLPLALLEEDWLAEQRIIMLQPRRIAARNAAHRMAELLGETVGETVGYRMRLDTRVGPRTRIEVVTEGVLLRMLRHDPVLEGVGLVMFDEFHERSLDADLSLALALNARETFVDEARFRLVVMSATLDGHAMEEILRCPRVSSEGRQYPVEIRYGQARKPRQRLEERVVQSIDTALRAHPNSSCLVFLPGQGEIHRVQALVEVPKNVQLCPLYGSLSMEEQRTAIAPSPVGQRKVVLATNIAETSLTIDGVDVVIDGGLERVPVFDPNTAMTRLHTVAISQASSKQRSGRAGRVRPGTCYRLWSENQQASLAAQQAPEIASADLAPLALQLLAWGTNDPQELHWLTPPPPGAWAQGLELLRLLGALHPERESPTLSEHGLAMADVGAHPRIGHLLLCGQAIGAKETASLLAAVLTERDPLSRDSPDMTLRLEYLQEERPAPPPLRSWLKRSQQLARQFERSVPPSPLAALQRPPRDQTLAYLLACAYPDRIARRRHSGGYQLANGRSADFSEPHAMGKEKWLVIAEVGGLACRRSDQIRSAAALKPELFETNLKDLIEDQTVIEWDRSSGRFTAEHQRRCGALRLSAEPIDTVPDAVRIASLEELLRESKHTLLNWTDEARRFQGRAATMATLVENWPDFDDSSLRRDLALWLSPYLGPVRKLSDLKKVNLLDALKARLSWDQQQQLDTWLPERIEVPSGSRQRIDYTQNPPVLAVKLQELFGCEETPTLAQGRLPLNIHLLSPAGRPLQVTQDLVSFWSNGYEQVRKEMKGRYPKHPWPDDPMTATATRHTKKRAAQSRD